jgi:transcriptional regulator with XRE-family HTH domain
MPDTTLNVEALYAALDRKRQAGDMSWRQVAGNLKIPSSTFTRMAQGRRPDGDSFTSLLRWLGMPAETFMEPRRRGGKEAEPLAMISSYLRSAPNVRREDAEALEDILQAAYKRLVRKP